MQCESCEERGAEVDALVEGEYKKLCKTCVVLDGAVIVPPAVNKSINDLYKRPTVREVLSRMSGVNRPAIDSYQMPKKEFGLEDLRARSTRYKAPKRNFESADSALSTLATAQTPAVQAAASELVNEAAPAAEENVEKKRFFGNILGFFKKKEKTPNPQEEPKVDMADQKERLNQARTQISADEVLEL